MTRHEDTNIACLPCAALALINAVQTTLLKKDALLIDFPMDTIGAVLDLIEPHFASERAMPSRGSGRPRLMTTYQNDRQAAG